MRKSLFTILSVAAIASLSACGGSSGSSRASLVFKQAECAEKVRIKGSFTTQYTLQNGKQTEVFVPSEGVTEAQAAAANACMAA